MPPETTEKRGVASEATPPDSTSPSRGPLVTTSEKTEDMRPRIASGVTVWLIVERHTALTLSAAPASANRAIAAHSERTSPANAIATPHASTAQITIRPRRRTCVSQPVLSAASVAPAETAANKAPVPAAPPGETGHEGAGSEGRGRRKALGA